MLRLDQYDTALRDIQRGRLGATSDEAFTAWDWTWSQMVVARAHASLVARFDEQSGALRAIAARLSSRPGQLAAAERARVRASELHDIAQRHREAADFFQQEAEAGLADCRALSKQAEQQQNGQQPQQPQNGQQQRRPLERPQEPQQQPQPE